MDDLLQNQMPAWIRRQFRLLQYRLEVAQIAVQIPDNQNVAYRWQGHDSPCPPRHRLCQGDGRPQRSDEASRVGHKRHTAAIRDNRKAQARVSVASHPNLKGRRGRKNLPLPPRARVLRMTYSWCNPEPLTEQHHLPRGSKPGPRP